MVRGAWGYYFYQGTSMATPHAAGVAALLVAVGATGAEARACLEETALDLGTSGWDATYGWGLIDAGAALAACDTTPADDLDGDGYTTTDGDCDDGNPWVHPGATEVCNDVDDDCDGLTDDASSDLDLSSATTWSADTDRDGFGDAATTVAACDTPPGFVADATDCNDEDASIYPGAAEIPLDGIDQDCDGYDSTVDILPPVVSYINHTVSGAFLTVLFVTDELSTGRVCTNNRYCASTGPVISHNTGSFYAKHFRTYTIVVTDLAGNSATFGPYRR
jgi:hypothetical protein